VSVAALSSYNLTSACVNDVADAFCDAKTSASNSCLREYSAEKGLNANVKTGSASMNNASAIPGRVIATSTASAGMPRPAYNHGIVASHASSSRKASETTADHATRLATWRSLK